MSQPLRVLGRTGIAVSPLGLGTAEIGFVYGIGKREVPPEDEAIALLKEAVERGITFIDTGHSYGVAEERIGKSGIANMPGVTVSTKCGHILDRREPISDADLADAFEKEVDESLIRLQADHVSLLQIHGGDVTQIRSGGIIAAAQKLKDVGKVQWVGISVRGEDAAYAAIESGFFDTLQIAYSILDQRMDNGVLSAAAASNIGVINRSVLLKGVLAKAERLPESLHTLEAPLAELANIAQSLGTDLPSLAIRFSLSNPGIQCVLVGSGKRTNVLHALDAAAQGPLPSDVLERLSGFAQQDTHLIDPREWAADTAAESA